MALAGGGCLGVLQLFDLEGRGGIEDCRTKDSGLQLAVVVFFGYCGGFALCVAGGAGFFEVGFACGGISGRRIFRLREFFVAFLLAGVVYPAGDVGDFAVAEIGELWHRVIAWRSGGCRCAGVDRLCWH